MAIWEGIKNLFHGLGNFFLGLFNLTSYPDLQKQINESLKEFSSQMSAIQKSLEANKEETALLSKKIDIVSQDLVKVKDGLQMELFNSLQMLHSKLLEQHIASVEDKKEAKLYYDQIHNLGKDGWSQKYFDEIIALPESKEEYYKTLK